MNCHIVPQCYLKSWKIPQYKKSIYVFSKNKLHAGSLTNISSMSRTNFAKSNEYILDLNNTYYMYKFYQEFVDTLKACNVKVFYNNVEINTKKLFLENIEHISQWDYRSVDSNKKADIMNIKKTWGNKVGNSIEKYFARELESNWGKILEYTENKIIKRKNTVQKKYYDELLEFVIVQLLRRKENLYELGLDWIINTLKSIFEEETKEDFSNIFNDEMKEASWIFELYKYVQNKNTENQNAIKKCIDVLKYQFQPCFIVSNSAIDFITSDNPCFLVKSNPNYTNGIYFPINKKVCLFMCRLAETEMDSKHYIILDADGNNVKYINNLVRKNALSHIAFYKDDVSKIISNKFVKASWFKMIKIVINKGY